MYGAALLLAACSPALDWREVPLAGTDLLGRFPCHPSHVVRNVELMGRQQQFALTSCDAGGVTYGIITTDVEDPTRVDAALTTLAEAARRSVGASNATIVPLAFAGVTPYRGDIRMRLSGRRGDGQGVEESISLFARGTRVFQATAIGPALPPAAVEPFHAGLRFRDLS